MTHQLRAVLAADAVGYSQAVAENDVHAVHALDGARGVFRREVESAGGRVVDTAGDFVLAVFESASACATAAVHAQSKLTAGSQALAFRIGLHLGDVIQKPDGSVYGDGINIAARLQAEAEARSILASDSFRHAVSSSYGFSFKAAGARTLKGVEAPLQVYRLELTPVAAPPQPEETLPTPVAAESEKPWLAVLPFRNLGSDDYFAEGIVEDIITAIARVKWIPVIARSSSFTFKNQNIDVREVARRLGVQYVLEGSIRQADGSLRISAQLVDAVNGRHLWADRYDGSVEKLFEFQDQITERVVATIEPAVQTAEIARALAKTTSNLGAYDLYLRSLPPFYSMTPKNLARAIELTDEAIRIDGSFALAVALGGFARGVRFSFGPTDADEKASVEMARRAVALAPEDPSVLRLAGHTVGYVAKHLEEAVDLLDRAIALNPNSAQAYISSGWVRLYAGDPRRALEDFTRAKRLNPLDPEQFVSLSGESLAFLMLGENMQALKAAEKATREKPNYPTAFKVLIFSLVRCGRLDEAKRVAKSFLAYSPGFTVAQQRRVVPSADAAFAEEYVQAFLSAGIPEN